MRKLISLIWLASFTFTACSGSGSSLLPPASRDAGSANVRVPAARAHPMRHHVRVALRIERSRNRHHKGSHYLPSTARSISFSVNNGTPQFANLPASTVYIDAPVGTDTFYINAYDERNGEGQILAQAAVTKLVALGQKNVVSATLNGVIASFTIALSNASPNAGSAATVPIIVTAYDADGNVIVGSTSDFSTPIRLSINDSTNSNTLSLTKTVLQGPWASASLVYNGGTLNSGLTGGPTAAVVASSGYLGSMSAAFTPSPTIYQFSIPVSSHKPQWIAAGPDGNMWFTESGVNSVGRITPAGVVTEFPIPTANAVGAQIIAGSDGNLWFTESGSTANKIARLTTTGAITEFSTLFAPPPADQPYGLVDRLDGTIWYVANGSSRVGFQALSGGSAGETSIPTSSSGPYGIATSPDDMLYYTENAVDKIGRIDNLFTAQSEISLTAGTQPRQIVRGPDGNLWFAEYGRTRIGRLNPTSFFVSGEFPTLTPNSGPTGIVVGKDGAMWFTEQGVDRIGRITSGGTMMEFAPAVTGLALTGIAVAADGSLWFCEPGSGANPGRIGRLVY